MLYSIRREDGWRTAGELTETEARVYLEMFQLNSPQFKWSIVEFEDEISEDEIISKIKLMLAPIGNYRPPVL